MLVSIHTAPDRAIQEIAALHQVVESARATYPNEDDFIVLGDFNADCDYADEAILDRLMLGKDPYQWIVPHDADTNLSMSSACAYDRIVITEGTAGDYTGEWGIDRSFTDKSISDHWPVWAKFHVGRDE